jgi:site-specific recombinase XerC
MCRLEKECPICAGKSEYSHITQAEIKDIVKNAVDKVYKLLWLNQNDPDADSARNYVFANGAGRYRDPDDLRRRVLYPAMDKAEIERRVARAYGFHLFRHSAGSQMQEVTGDLKQTQSFLGRSGIGITSDVYVHLQPDSEVASMEKLEESLFGELCSTVLKTGVEGQSELVN